MSSLYMNPGVSIIRGDHEVRTTVNYNGTVWAKGYPTLKQAGEYAAAAHLIPKDMAMLIQRYQNGFHGDALMCKPNLLRELGFREYPPL